MRTVETVMFAEQYGIWFKAFFVCFMAIAFLTGLRMFVLALLCRVTSNFRHRPWVKRLIRRHIRMSSLNLFRKNKAEENLFSLWLATGFLMATVSVLGFFLEVNTW